MDHPNYDLAIIGGGINGAGVAADAAGRGLSVVLIEKDDLASGTSSASSKLIHGGLRYLEQFEFGLVRQSLAEREILLRKAPHIVWPLRFIIPPHPYARSHLLLRAGLFLYDNLSRRVTLGRSSTIDLASDPCGAILANRHGTALTYWDCWVDDARLVVLNARHAASLGATVLTRTACVAAVTDQNGWRLTLKTHAGPAALATRAVVNTAGPAAAAVAQLRTPSRNAATVRTRLVKGSHIVVRRTLPGGSALLMQNHDGRVVFALPFEDNFTLIGTTDEPYEQHEGPPRPSAAEVDYLCAVASSYLSQPVTRQDIIWSFAGVRALDDDGSAEPSQVTRDYRVAVAQMEPAWIDVIGGKITTYRRLAEGVMAALAPAFPGLPGPWTRAAVLPGGDLPADGADGLRHRLALDFPAIDDAYLRRLVRRYGTCAREILDGAMTLEDLGPIIANQLTRREVQYLAKQEWARTADDVLWRRTKSGLSVHSQDLARVTAAIEEAL